MRLSWIVEANMNRTTQWLSLIAGICLLLYGISKLYLVGEWALFVLAVLIIAFTLSSMSKSKPEK
jgi:membrane-associated PAP2 superfamily phosphatase